MINRTDHSTRESTRAVNNSFRASKRRGTFSFYHHLKPVKVTIPVPRPVFFKKTVSIAFQLIDCRYNILYAWEESTENGSVRLPFRSIHSHKKAIPDAFKTLMGTFNISLFWFSSSISLLHERWEKYEIVQIVHHFRNRRVSDQWRMENLINVLSIHSDWQGWASKPESIQSSRVVEMENALGLATKFN